MLFFNTMAVEVKKNFRQGKLGAALGWICSWILLAFWILLSAGGGIFLLGATLHGAFSRGPWTGIITIMVIIGLAWGLRTLVRAGAYKLAETMVYYATRK